MEQIWSKLLFIDKLQRESFLGVPQKSVLCKRNLIFTISFASNLLSFNHRFTSGPGGPDGPWGPGSPGCP